MRRRAAFIGAPDPALLPEALGARSVLFRAGLELGVMHRALSVMSWLRRRRLIPTPASFVGILRKLAVWMERLGSDEGGMVVRVLGRAKGAGVEARWACRAPAGVGPFVPALPALILIRALAEGSVVTGARPAIAAFGKADIEAALNRIGMVCEATSTPFQPLFQAALPKRWHDMPEQWRQLHEVWDQELFRGEASVRRGGSVAAGLLCRLFGFPPSAEKVEVQVTMTRQGGREIWQRDFDGRRFYSVLRGVRPGQVSEQFGPFRFLLDLTGEGDRMGMEVRAGWFLGLPWPRALLPRSDTFEFVQDGRVQFDVNLSLPLIGALVRYRGWLVPVVPRQ